MKSNSSHSPETTAVLDNQAAIAATKASIKKLEKALGNCAAQIEERRVAMTDLAPLQSEREDLLAAVAIGEKKQSDVEKLDATIDKFSAQHKDAKPALDAINQTIGGLQRRMEESNATLVQLQGERAVLLRQFLNARAEALGAEYVEAAKLLSSQYARLLAIDALLGQAGRPQGLKIGGGHLNIPNFHLESMAAATHRVFTNTIYNTQLDTGRELFPHIEKEKNSLSEIGIELA